MPGSTRGLPKPRPSQVFATRLREIRKRRDDVSQEKLAEWMTKAGHPMSTLTLLRIENGARVPSLDEALALAHLLEVAPAHLLSPSGGDVWLTDNFGIDGAGMRNFLVFGDPLLLTPPGRRASLRIRLVHALEVHAQALVDAKRGGDRAGVQTAAKAISDLLGEHRDQIGDIEEEPEEETT